MLRYIPKIKSMKVSHVFMAAACLLSFSWIASAFFGQSVYDFLVSHYSFLQLFVTSYLAYLSYKILAADKEPGITKNATARFFLIAACGFLFLMLDDLLSLHENMDRMIHFAFNMEETYITDHIDDVILMAYGIPALVFAVKFLPESRRYGPMPALIAAGFIAFCVLCVLDFLSNNDETFQLFFSGSTYLTVAKGKSLMNMADASFKVVGEAFFLSAFLVAYGRVKAGACCEEGGMS